MPHGVRVVGAVRARRRLLQPHRRQVEQLVDDLRRDRLDGRALGLAQPAEPRPCTFQLGGLEGLVTAEKGDFLLAAVGVETGVEHRDLLAGFFAERRVGGRGELAQRFDHGAEITALHVVRIPLEQALDAELIDAQERAESSLAEAKLLAAELDVTIDGVIARARAIGEAIIEVAVERGADLIVMGSSPRWRRQARFFSPTVDYVLRHADCEVMVIAYPQGVLEEEEVGVD